MPSPQRARERMGASGFAGLHVLVDDDPRWPLGPVDQAHAACRGGAPVIQLRAKYAGDAQILALAREIRELTQRAGIAFVLNDRYDLAWLAGADAVHLGQDDFPPAKIPAHVRAALAVGRSTDTLAQAEAATREPIDYIAYGPVFGTDSKRSEYGERGLVDLSRVAEIAGDLPLVAIGGIAEDNLADVLEAGARGVAVISAVAGADDPEQATRSLAARMRGVVRPDHERDSNRRTPA